MQGRAEDLAPLIFRHEAGGAMTALDGRPLITNRPDRSTASGRERHAALADLIRAQTRELV